MNVFTCPHCGSNNIQLRFPVWVDANALLNDGPLDGGDLVQEVLDSYEASQQPMAWICIDCTATSTGAPGEIEEVVEAEIGVRSDARRAVHRTLLDADCDDRSVALPDSATSIVSRGSHP